MEPLIKLVRENRALYDTTDKNYMRSKLKDRIWENIATKLNYENGQTAKDSWRKLRDCHRDALRRQGKKKSESADPKIKMWSYQEQMEFLVPHMGKHGNMDKGQKDGPPLSDNSSDMNDDIELSSETPACITTPDAVNAQGKEIDLEQPEPSCSKTLKKPNKTRKLDDLLHRLIKTYNMRSKERMERRKMLAPSFQEENKKDDERTYDSLYPFFLAMHHATKQLSKGSQLRIKKILFDAVHREEESASSDTRNLTNLSTTPHFESDQLSPQDTKFDILPMDFENYAD